MNRYIDINQLLGELGTSDRSAGDPWTLSRGRRGTVNGDAFKPAVEADLGAPLQDLKGEIQSSEQVTQAATVPSSSSNPSGGSGPSTGSSFLGGLLNLFPLASGIAKLFGFGESTPAPALTPYQLPPSINFEGSLSGMGAGALWYGSDGLPRTSLPSSTVAAAATSSNFTETPAAMVSDISHRFLSEGNNASAGAGIVVDNTESTTGVADQIGNIGIPNFVADPATGPSTVTSGLMSGSQTLAANATGADAPDIGGSAVAGANPGNTNTQQGHSILVQVQAMDSQSFMDHSQDIAQAVRQAMLNLNSLNDVVQDL